MPARSTMSAIGAPGGATSDAETACPSWVGGNVPAHAASSATSSGASSLTASARTAEPFVELAREQIGDDVAELELALARLEAPPGRVLHRAFRVGVARGLEKEVGIAPKL